MISFPSIRPLVRAAFTICLLACAVPAWAAADVARRNYEVPAGDAATTLKQFAEQSGEQVMFLVNKVSGVQTAAVKGELTAREALDRMVAGTELVVVQDEKTGALAVKRAAGPNAPRAAQMAISDRPDPGSKVENGMVKLEQMEVTGSRIRTVVGEQTLQPISTITRQDLDHYGVNSLGEVFRYIPQVSNFSLGQLVQIGTTTPLQAGTSSARVTATLRGAPAGGTLLLINGRRAPKNGQVDGGDAYDLSGIPMAAIERIDVLLDGASAIYGADAVGGVINVILRKHYQGSEIRLGYENAFTTDVSVKTASFTHGFATGKLSGMITGSWESAGSMFWRDRSFLSTVDRRAWGGFDYRSPVDGRGTIRLSSGTIPGLGSATTTIPAGSDGVNVTIADYANAGAVPDVIRDRAQFMQYSTPYRRRAVSANLEYEFNPALVVFAESRWGDSLTSSTSTPINAISSTIPVGAPGNPFSVPIVLNKSFYDLPLQETDATITNLGHLLGVRGQIFGDWRYESTIGLTRSRPGRRADYGLFFNAALVAAAYANPNPAQRPVLLYDSTSRVSPNPASIPLLTVSPSGGENIDAWTYDVKADGPLFTLPGGDVRAAVGAEYREDYVDFPFRTTVGPPPKNRQTSGYFAEILVPVVSERQGWPLMRRVELSVSARHDRYSDFPETTNPRYGVLYQPTRWLMMRASYGEGYKVPTLSQLYAPVLLGGGLDFPTGVVDPLRGNTLLTGVIPFDTGGNANLHPERSKNKTAGIVVEVPGAKGLSFSVDYFDTEYLDRVGSVPLQDRLILFPETIHRGPTVPTDPAGWAGPVTGYANFNQNIATNRVAGYDFGLKYLLKLPQGDLSARSSISYTTRNEIRALPGQPLTTASTKDALPLQGTGSIFWSHAAWETGVLATYRGRYRPNNLASTLFTPSAVRWDWQASYDFARDPGMAQHRSAWWGEVLSDTRVSVTVFNVLNTQPPMDGDGFPDNRIVDSRLRRYSLQLSRKF